MTHQSIYDWESPRDSWAIENFNFMEPEDVNSGSWGPRRRINSKYKFSRSEQGGTGDILGERWWDFYDEWGNGLGTEQLFEIEKLIYNYYGETQFFGSSVVDEGDTIRIYLEGEGFLTHYSYLLSTYKEGWEAHNEVIEEARRGDLPQFDGTPGELYGMQLGDTPENNAFRFFTKNMSELGDVTSFFW